jgi:hypothetical protein
MKAFDATERVRDQAGHELRRRGTEPPMPRPRSPLAEAAAIRATMAQLYRELPPNYLWREPNYRKIILAIREQTEQLRALFREHT